MSSQMMLKKFQWSIPHRLMSTATFKQEMPPPGGFSAFEWQKKQFKPKWTWWKLWTAYAGVTIFSWGTYYYARDKARAQQLERDDIRCALEPLMLAEADRMFLKQVWENREEEKELMKDVEGWEIGKLYGESVYHDESGENKLPTPKEFFLHLDPFRRFRQLHDAHFRPGWTP
ncbi:hypothetical protein SNEBB_001440 [Seison nebaliae]|nr:hypothetical protein SNEBB_001440 [Seison nebaliae]